MLASLQRESWKGTACRQHWHLPVSRCVLFLLSHNARCPASLSLIAGRPFVLQVAHTKVRMIESICTVPPIERSLTSYQGSSPEPRRLGHRQQLEKLSRLCNLCLPSGALSPESGWLTGPWGEVSSDAEGACWGSLWGLSNILKGSLFLSLGPLRNVFQLFHSFKPQFFFNDCGLWILLCLRHKLEPLEQFSQYYSSRLDT